VLQASQGRGGRNTGQGGSAKQARPRPQRALHPSPRSRASKARPCGALQHTAPRGALQPTAPCGALQPMALIQPLSPPFSLTSSVPPVKLKPPILPSLRSMPFGFKKSGRSLLMAFSKVAAAAWATRGRGRGDGAGRFCRPLGAAAVRARPLRRSSQRLLWPFQALPFVYLWWLFPVFKTKKRFSREKHLGFREPCLSPGTATGNAAASRASRRCPTAAPLCPRRARWLGTAAACASPGRAHPTSCPYLVGKGWGGSKWARAD
jgi:hypothetical protein